MGRNKTGNGYSSSNKKQKQRQRGPGIAELERQIRLQEQQQQQQQQHQQISPPYNPPVRAPLPTQVMGVNETENGSSSSNINQSWRGPGIAELQRQIIRRQQQQQQQQQMAPLTLNNPPLPPYPPNFNIVGIFQPNNPQEVPRLLLMPYSSIPSSSSSSYTPHSASYAFRPNNIGMVDQSSHVETINSYGNSQSNPILIDNIDEEKERIQTTSNLENQPSAQSNIPPSLPYLNDSQGIDTNKYGSGSAGSSSQKTQNSESSDTTQELDLDLRL